MRYVNRRSGTEIDLAGLTEDEAKFYRRAFERFRQNFNWLAFDEFVFSPASPIYSRRRSHLDVLRDPLYLALKDMWLELGVRQGIVAGSKKASRQPSRRPASLAVR